MWLKRSVTPLTPPPSLPAAPQQVRPPWATPPSDSRYAPAPSPGAHQRPAPPRPAHQPGTLLQPTHNRWQSAVLMRLATTYQRIALAVRDGGCLLSPTTRRMPNPSRGGLGPRRQNRPRPHGPAVLVPPPTSRPQPVENHPQHRPQPRRPPYWQVTPSPRPMAPEAHCGVRPVIRPG